MCSKQSTSSSTNSLTCASSSSMWCSTMSLRRAGVAMTTWRRWMDSVIIFPVDMLNPQRLASNTSTCLSPLDSTNFNLCYCPAIPRQASAAAHGQNNDRRNLAKYVYTSHSWQLSQIIRESLGIFVIGKFGCHLVLKLIWTNGMKVVRGNTD